MLYDLTINKHLEYSCTTQYMVPLLFLVNIIVVGPPLPPQGSKSYPQRKGYESPQQTHPSPGCSMYNVCASKFLCFISMYVHTV